MTELNQRLFLPYRLGSIKINGMVKNEKNALAVNTLRRPTRSAKMPTRMITSERTTKLIIIYIPLAMAR